MAVYTRQYTQGVGWENEPSINTPISAENLNQMDNAIMDVDAAVAAAFANLGSGRCFSDHIVSVNNSGNLITNTATFDGTTPQTGDLLFLYSEIDAPQTSEPTWYTRFGATASVYGQILDYRDGATGGLSSTNRFTDAIAAGSVLILTKTSIINDWGLRAIIPAAGGGVGSAYGNYIETIDRSYSSLNTDISFSDSITAHDGEVFFLTSKAANSVNPSGWRVKMNWVDGSTSTYTRLLLMDINAETLSDVFTASVAEGDILVVKLVIGDPSDVNTWKCDLLARIRPSGGGGGTTVVANPSGPASSDLEKLQVGNTIYAINAGNSAEGNKITSTSRTDPDKLVTNIQLDSGIAEHEGDVFYLTSELDTGTSSTGWNVKLQYAVGEGGYADTYVPLFGMNPTTVMDMFDDNIAAGDILVVKVTHSGIVQSYAMYILAYISASGGGASTLAGLTDTNIVSPSDRQYLKYNATSGKWENVSAAKTFVKATPNMTGYTTPSGVVSASSEYNGNYAAWYAFDGVYGYDTQTWASSGGHTVGEWIQYLFSSAKIIKKIATVNRNEYNPRAIKTFKFQGSNDGTTFTDIASCEITSGTPGYRQEFDINNDTAYLYYRLYVTEPWIPNDLTVGLAELELFEEVEVEVAELDDLVDVDVNLSVLTDGQALVYDNSLGKWTNSKAVGVAGGGTGNSSGYVRIGQKENTSIGAHATAEGTNNTATGDDAHTEGYSNTASQPHTHAEGEQCQATEWWAHAEGFQSVASGRVSHAEGMATTASAYYAHSEGQSSRAWGNVSHAEGLATTASGAESHAQNTNTTASGSRSSAAGYYTTAGYECQFVIGKFNDNKSANIFEVGNGTDGNTRSNALELTATGNLKTAGTITDGNGNVLGQPVAVDGVWVISGETATLTVTTP